MTIQDHVEDCRTTAALYSLDALPPDERANFEQRLKSGCPLCMAEYAEYACVADEIAQSVPVQSPAPSVRQRLLDRIGAAPSKPSSQSSKHEMKLVRASDTQWKSLPFPGVEVRPLLGQKTLLVRMQPGSVYPSHEHRYAEQCYVLEGSVTDSMGVTAFAGDFVCMPAGSTHQEIRTETGCVFLLAYTA
jgi:quercetin dioxygenase-like cupin family protein